LRRHAVGGLLTVSVGSITERVMALFVLARREAAVVKAQTTGFIIGTSLPGPGPGSPCRSADSRVNARPFTARILGCSLDALLLLVVALLRPAALNLRAHAGMANTRQVNEWLSIGASIVSLLLLLYGANLVVTLVTYRGVFASDKAGGTSAWSLTRSLAVSGAARSSFPSNAS
jgi:calcium/proton exchanger cax